MPISVPRARTSRVAEARAQSRAVARALAGFRRPFRRRVAWMAERHPALADLAVTFPGLLLTLATPRSGRDHARAIELATACAPLQTVAAAAGVPFWLRRLPPEAFGDALHGLPDGEGFRCRIANHLPRSRKSAATWLKSVTDAARWCGQDFALWIARELSRDRKAIGLSKLPLLCLYAWYSACQNTSAHFLIRRPWHPAMRASSAFAEIDEWRTDIALRLAIGDTPFCVWLEPCSVRGFEFIPLRTRDDVVEEALAMRNCLRGYGYQLANNWGRLWSIRRATARVATLWVGFYGGRPLPEIIELQGRDNSEASKEVWLAARQWFDEHRLADIEPKWKEEPPLDRAVWIDLWRPYWLAKRRIPSWLPLVPSRDAVKRLLHSRNV